MTDIVEKIIEMTNKAIDKYREDMRLRRLKILLTALYDKGYRLVRKTLFIKLVFLIDHYLNRELSIEPRIFGYKFYVYRYGVFTAQLLVDLEKLGVQFEKVNNKRYILIDKPHIDKNELSEEEKKLYEDFLKMIDYYVVPYENTPDELTLYILENILGISPGQKVFYYYVYVRDILKNRPNSNR